ncbi:PTS fructose transporter subunit IIA [Olsenella umbonata]|uniref:PTS fructose transporter subunit IIA n=1 Tax=Parafannyhessea umbonata TaxID=604330 RepID=A0A7X9T9G3_9ACTN|nr:PTS fructose transporter subunit IIA [Parafannyhessea umbonata]NMF25328.1 PTS fructose transporter subunit IIA [Parafannyhessea umbonata]
MVGIIVTGHGNFASGITSALELIAGPQDAYAALDFTSLSGTEELEKGMASALESLRLREDVDGVLVLCDLVGGTPFKTAATLGIPLGDVRVVAGVNLGGLVECATQRDAVSGLDELAQLAKDSMKSSVVEFELAQPAEEDEDFSDGI